MISMQAKFEISSLTVPRIS